MSTFTQKIDDIMDRPVDGPPLQKLREKRKLLSTAIGDLLARPTTERRDLLASESRDFDYAMAKINGVDLRLDDLEAKETRSLAADAAMAVGGDIGTQRSGPRDTQHWHHTGGGETYHRGNDSPSFFRDLINSQRGDANAADRLRRNNQETGLESRALGNTGGAGGSGGEFAPPSWLVDRWVGLARPGRVTADLFHHEDLPAGVSSVNLPRVATGTTTAVQTTQNTALSQTDLTTNSLTSSIVTIAGKQVVAQQLLDQSGTRFDEVVLEDLAGDYAKQLGIQVLTGTGASGQLKGYLTPASTNNQTWTQAAPTPSLLYSQIGKLLAAYSTSRYATPDTVVMHPRRWAWLASYTDTTGRPLVSPTAGGYNSLATPGAVMAAGHAGSVMGLDVWTDPNIPINLGAGTNQDVVLMFKRDDVWLWESSLRAEALTQTYGDSLGVLFRVYNYAALIPDRYLAGLGQIQGTGLVSPTFAG